MNMDNDPENNKSLHLHCSNMLFEICACTVANYIPFCYNLYMQLNDQSNNINIWHYGHYFMPRWSKISILPTVTYTKYVQ